jgi:hypothetical protein
MPINPLPQYLSRLSISPSLARKYLYPANKASQYPKNNRPLNKASSTKDSCQMTFKRLKALKTLQKLVSNRAFKRKLNHYEPRFLLWKRSLRRWRKANASDRTRAWVIVELSRVRLAKRTERWRNWLRDGERRFTSALFRISAMRW